MQHRACPNCGRPASDHARFCVECGATLPDAAVLTALAEPEATVRAGVPWRALDALWVFLIQIGVGAALAAPFLIAVGPDSDVASVAAVLIGEAVLLATLLIWIWFRHRAGPADIGLRGFTGANVGLGLAAGLGGLLASAIITAIIALAYEAITNTPIPEVEQIPIDEGAASGSVLLTLGISVVLLAPLAEEAFFRGFLYPALRRWARPWAAVLLSAAIFSVTHVYPIVLLPIFALGILLAWLVEWRRSIVPALVAHVTFNAVGFYVGFIADPGRAPL